MASGSFSSSGNNIRVICRFRPANDNEKREEKLQSLGSDEPTFKSTREVILKRPPKSEFKCVLDHMFKMNTNQKKVFDLVGRPLVQEVLKGFNSTIFAYGQTGSGKTYTMFGPDQRKRKTDMDLGLVQRCCTYLFDKLRNKLKTGKAGDVVLEWQVTASFIQIYKEHISDLLEPTMRNLQIRTDFQTDTPYVENLKVVSVNSLEEVLINLGIAFSNRKVASHKLNSESSRSHMLLMLDVEQKMRDGAVKRSKLNFGDLAGSEDIRKALGPNADPERMQEAIAINSTLTALTTAINYLSRGQRPSYRSSSLTHILQDSLGGNSKTTMIVAASPHTLNRSETIRTLRFASTAKKVKNKAKINRELTKGQLMRRIEELEAMNAKLSQRVIELETQMRAAGMEVKLTKELYKGDADGNYTSASDIDTDDDIQQLGGKKVKLSLKSSKRSVSASSPNVLKFAKPKLANGASADSSRLQPSLSSPSHPTTDDRKSAPVLTMETQQNGITQVSNHQMELLKREVKAANERAKHAQERNADLEQRKVALAQEMDDINKTLSECREKMDEMNQSSRNWGKERQMLEDRNSEMQKEFNILQAQKTKQTNELDKQIQRQRANINMKSQENKSLQKQVKELNLQNEELLKQYDLITKQMSALKRMADSQSNSKHSNSSDSQPAMDNDTKMLLKELDNVQLDGQEQEMEPADLLLHRFAAMEANDFRLTPEQRMKKTAKMMTDISDDINALMGQWLPKNKVRSDRTKSKTLVFQVRQLIGHFNVLVGQMKATEEGFQNDLRLDIQRRDREIKSLKEQNKLIHKLQDDLEEKNDTIEQLKKHRDDLRVERDHLKTQTVEQQDMIFDVQNQVRYLNNELERNRLTLVNLRSSSMRDVLMSDGLMSPSVMSASNSGLTEYPEEGQTDSDLDDDDGVYGDRVDDEYNMVTPSSSTPLGASRRVKISPHSVSLGQKDFRKMAAKNKGRATRKDKGKESRGSVTMQDQLQCDEGSASPSFDRNSVVIHDEISDEESGRDQMNLPSSHLTSSASAPLKSVRKSSKKKPRRKSTFSRWRESLKPGEQLDCQDESGLWWTAKVMGYKGNTDRLQIRYDGWGDQYDEVIARESDRLAVYKSKYHSLNNDGNKLIREGFMEKEGKMFKTWRKRYFQLDDQGKLSYYHNQGDENAIGTVDIKKMKKTERCSFGRNRLYGVQIHTNDRVWKFLCGSEKDLAEWIHALNFVKAGEYEED